MNVKNFSLGIAVVLAFNKWKLKMRQKDSPLPLQFPREAVVAFPILVTLCQTAEEKLALV